MLQMSAWKSIPVGAHAIAVILQIDIIYYFYIVIFANVCFAIYIIESIELLKKIFSGSEKQRSLLQEE